MSDAFYLAVFLFFVAAMLFYFTSKKFTRDVKDSIAPEKGSYSCDPWKMHCDRNPNNWCKHRVEPSSTIHKDKIVIVATRLYLLILYCSCNMVLLSQIGSALLNVWV